MNYGGGVAGFIATRDSREYVGEYPSRLFGIAKTEFEGEWGFGDVFYERTSFARRELGKEYVGTGTALWGITAGVYLALMGPKGMRDLGETIMQKAAYAAKSLSKIKPLRISCFESLFFKEFVVNFDETSLTAKEVNSALRKRGIWGGKDISREFPELGESALFCVTEMHLKEDVSNLCGALAEIVSDSKKGE